MRRIIPPQDPGPRPTAVHRAPCRRCPSAQATTSPEAEDILAMVRSGEMLPEEAVFTCGWRPGRLCRGVVDRVEQAVRERDACAG